MKLCSTCGNPGEFSQNHTKKDGLNTVCKECQKKASKAHYQANKKEYIRKAKARRRYLRSIITEAKRKPCVDCGRSFHPVAMDLDHVRGKKVTDVSRMVQDFSEEKLRAEIAKCDVRCAVCHRLRTHGLSAPVLMEQAPAFEAG